MSSAKPSPLAGWAQLLRLPNLFTVPGDPLVGFAVAAPALTFESAWCAAAAICLYCAGLITNDLFDFREDLQDRPQRPIPAQIVSKASAIVAAIVFAAMGLSLAFAAEPTAGLCALALLIAILVYNGHAKHCSVGGPIFMGLCRALSVLLGTFAAVGFSQPPMLAWIAAGTIGLYIAAVTIIARAETKKRRIGLIRQAPAAAIALWCALLAVSSLADILAGQIGYLLIAFLSLLACSWAVQCGTLLRGSPEPQLVQRVIGMFIRGLLPLQAGFLAILSISPEGQFLWAGAIAAAIAIILWPIATIASHRFYAS